MNTRWRPGMARGIAAVLAASALAGCSVARVNHLHSDANQRQMDKALEAFTQSTSDRAGLGPTLLKNLQAVTTLRRTVADTRSHVDDMDRATELQSTTWLEMRKNFLHDVGFTPESSDAKDVRKSGALLSERIQRRVERIQAVVKVLEALILGDRALVAQAKADVERAAKSAAPPAKAGANTSAPVAEAQDRSLLDLLVAFQRAVVQAGRDAAKDEEALATATALEKALRDEAAKSRDPAAVFALVAVVGTGLDDDSFQGLDAFLAGLDERLEDFRKTAKDACDKAKGKTCPDPWQEFLKAATVAGHLVAAGHVQSLLSEGPGPKARERLKPAPAQARELPRTVPKELARRLPAVVGPGGVVARPEAEAYVVTQRADARAAAKRSADSPEAKPPAASTDPTEPLDPGKAIAALLALTEQMSVDIDDLRDQIEALPASFGSFAGATDLLRKAFAADPKLFAQLGGGTAISQADLTQLGALIAGIGQERDAAAQRVADYVKTLHRIQLDLHEENLRHDQAIVAIAAQEIKRWILIQTIDRKSARVFAEEAKWEVGEGPTADFACEPKATKPKPSQPAPSLFATADRSRCWTQWYTTVQPHDLPKGAAHPAVDRADRVLPTVRRLAEMASVWQKASPNLHDPRGFDGATSYHRLSQGVEMVNAHLLMRSLNQRLAADNRIRLSTEVAEHRLHLDGIAARAEEAGLNLALGDVAAFHASGITNSDLQTIFSAVQSVLLAVIGGKI